MSRTPSQPTSAQNTGRRLPQKRRRLRQWWWLLGLLAPLAALAAEPAARPLPADKAAKAAIVPDGFRVTVFAAEPDIVQPISFCTDARGRLWVAEALNYGAWQPTGKDRIVILEDTDGDGKFDSSKVFADHLVFPQGVMWRDGALYVASHPSIWRLEDTDGDGVADKREELIGKFGFTGNGCDIHGPFAGPDGPHAAPPPPGVSRPPPSISRWLMLAHFEHILPLMTRISTRSEAARLLMKYYWDTIDQCVPPETILEVLRRTGFVDVDRRVFLGCLNEYVAAKPPR